VKALEGKTCVITGGAGSVGAATGTLFLKEGARVMLVDSDVAALDRAAAALEATPDRLTTCRADVSRTEDVQRYIRAATETFGPIDVLFSHAGVAGVISPVTDYPEDVFDAVVAVNLRGSFLACKYGLPAMNDGGSIIITSSIMGVTADPGVSAYAASKHALVGLARVVAKEAAGRAIRVNVLAPGPIANPFQTRIEERLTEVVGQDGTEFLDHAIPLGRHSRPEEVAQTALFLASDQSSFSTGAVFMVDGGMGI